MKRFKRLFILLALTILTIVALATLGNVELNWQTLERVQWGWMVVVVVIFYSTILVRGIRWHRILQAMGWAPGLRYTSTLMIAGLFISAILPARLGDIGRVVLLKQDHKIPMAHGIASIATERALDVFSILFLAIGGGLWALQGRLPIEYLQLMIGTAILLLLGLVGLLLMPKLEQWLRVSLPRLFYPASSPAPRIWVIYHKLLDFGFSMIHGVRALGKHPGALLIALGQSFYIWLGDGLLIYFTLVSIKATAPLSVTLFSMMVSDLIAAVPITPGAIGQFEVALAGILTVLGVARADSTLGAILLRLVSLWTLIPVSGLITYIFGFSRALDLTPNSVMAEGEFVPTPSSAASSLDG